MSLSATKPENKDSEKSPEKFSDNGIWQTVIGLEIHARIVSKSKLFSGASARYGGAPNSRVSFVDAGFPGMLPVLNRECIKQAVRTGLALGAKINKVSYFARKNYFYPDLPQGYQISQYEHPIVGAGEITLPLEDETLRIIGLERIHIEQDAGKSSHDQLEGKSCIDLNRAGCGLMEIVTRPDMRSAEEAAAFLLWLRAILRTIGSCDGNMQEGSLRVDANISVKRTTSADLGTRCEIKNLNSARFLRQALEFEAQRQIDILQAGGTITQQTRLFDPARGETRPMRDKEDAHDYRYFPCPDLPAVCVTDSEIAEWRASLPELPAARCARFEREYGLVYKDARALIAEPERADYFAQLAQKHDGRLAANWVLTELLGRLNKIGKDISESPVSAENLGELLDLLSSERISGRTAKQILDEMFKTSGKSANSILKEQNLGQISDTSELERIIDEITTANSAQFAQFCSGNDKLLAWFVGQVMRKTLGKANPGMVNEILVRKRGEKT